MMPRGLLGTGAALLVLSWILVTFAPPFAPLPAQESGGGGGGASTKANLDLPFSARGEEEEEDEPPPVIIFYNQQYEGDGIFFSCDKSGSMREGGKFTKLKSEVIKNVMQFSERVQFGIVFFAGDSSKFPSSGRPANATPDMKAAAQSWVLAATTGRGGSCVKMGLVTALNYANQSSARRKLIIHLADGFTNCPGMDEDQYGRETLAEVTQKNVQRIRINSICIGPPGEVNEDWMRKLASQNGGQYARIVQ